MEGNHIHFLSDKLDFSTLDASDIDGMSVEYVDKEFSRAAGIIGGKIRLLMSFPYDVTSISLLVEEEPIIEYEKASDEFILTDATEEPYILEYDFSQSEIDDIKNEFIEYIHCFLYEGGDYVISEMS